MTKGLVIDRDADLRRELRVYLDTLSIDGDNIGAIRRSLFLPWKSQWNGWVRDETASRESPAMTKAGEMTDAALRTLIEKWRAESGSWEPGIGSGLEMCADELEALLASPLHAGAEPGYTFERLAEQLGLGNAMTAKDVFEWFFYREQLLRDVLILLETHKSSAHTTLEAVSERIAALSSSRTAPQEKPKALETEIPASLVPMPKDGV